LQMGQIDQCFRITITVRLPDGYVEREVDRHIMDTIFDKCGGEVIDISEYKEVPEEEYTGLNGRCAPCCKGCICQTCINTMHDGGNNNCFHCEYCTDGDGHKKECGSYSNPY
jgi:hypothetical protein